MTDHGTTPDDPTHDVQEPLAELLPFVENPDQRAPCALVLDTSYSMGGAPIAALNAGLHTFRQSLLGDELARRRVEPAVVTFSDQARLVRDFTTADELDVPELAVDGVTAMAAGVDLALDTLERRKDVYRRAGVPYYRPWLFLMTDGAPTDAAHEIEAMRQRLRRAQADRKIVFFAVGVGHAQMDFLAKLSDTPPARLDGLRFEELFRWLSQSMTRVSQSRPGDAVQPAPIGNWGRIET